MSSFVSYADVLRRLHKQPFSLPSLPCSRTAGQCAAAPLPPRLPGLPVQREPAPPPGLAQREPAGRRQPLRAVGEEVAQRQQFRGAAEVELGRVPEERRRQGVLRCHN